MKELQLEIIYQKVIMINVLHVGLLLQKRIKSSIDYKKGVYCPKCKYQTTKKQKKGFEERTRQISIAKKKGFNHLGG